MSKVLILHINEFGGHSKAAFNLKEALRYRNPAIEARNLNGLGFFYPRGEQAVDFLYTTVIKHFPSFWGKIYDQDKVFKKLTPVRNMVNNIAFKKLNRLINDFPPNCIVATQAFPCGVVADFNKKYNSPIPLLAVVTDYHPHKFWIHDYVDRYVVACRDAQEVLMGHGVPQEKIKIFGIPISVDFLHSHPHQDIVTEFGFAGDLTSILIMGGGFGLGPIEDIALHLDKLDFNTQLIVVCGRNKKAYDWFVKNKRKFRKPIFPFGYVNCINKLMDFSDIIITKAGGITVSEALAKGLAIVITNPIPGQEERNVEYLLKQEAIVKADNVSDVPAAVKGLLDDKKKMFSLKERAKDISFIDSSVRIVDLIQEMII